MTTTFTVWAPDAGRVDLDLVGQPRAMRRVETDDPTRRGWWSLDVPEAGHGDAYAYRVDGGDPRPDPRSLWQPDGVHAPSRVYEHDRFAWSDQGWHGVPLAGHAVYELHTGTFTPQGTFAAAIERLDHLVGLGIGLVEVLPVASFDGPRGWGYDGVALYAAQESYGGPDGFKAFVDACHARGLGVVLDVVYNHLGPSGNYLGEFGPYFTDKHVTPWGAGVNLDDARSAGMRGYIIDNALSWLRDFHVDGLRLDAVHALKDERATHVLEELSSEVDALATALGRPLSLIAESDLNDPRVVTPREAHGYGITAQWSDDFHHAMHALLTGERQGYYGDFGPVEALAKVLTRAFFHDGTWSSFRERLHGRPVDTELTPAHRFVGYLQDHDQIGNRATGDRIGASLSAGLQRVGAALYLTSPFTPMVFMGEEWGASTPWQFFTSFPDPELGEAVRTGRRGEFASHGWDAEDVPDPQDPATARASTLDWSELDREPHAGLLRWYRDLLALRRVTPELTDPRLSKVAVAFDEDARWLLVDRGAVQVAYNLTGSPQEVPLPVAPAAVLLASAQGVELRSAGVALPAESVAVLRS